MSEFKGVSHCCCEQPEECVGGDKLPADEFCSQEQALRGMEIFSDEEIGSSWEPADSIDPGVGMINDLKVEGDAVVVEGEEGTMRAFQTGATRNIEVDPDIYGFTSPLALGLFAEYMHANRLQADGTMRDSDNWKKGIPLDSYIRSMRRHMQDLTLIHDGYEGLAREGLMEALGGLFFNVQGYMHEIVKQGMEAAALEEKINDVVAALFESSILVPADTTLITTDEGE